MNGKIFADSSSLCQDEAKILFDFYRQAAEKIVGEEERIEKEINKQGINKKERGTIITIENHADFRQTRRNRSYGREEYKKTQCFL